MVGGGACGLRDNAPALLVLFTCKMSSHRDFQIGQVKWEEGALHHHHHHHPTRVSQDIEVLIMSAATLPQAAITGRQALRPKVRYLTSTV